MPKVGMKRASTNGDPILSLRLRELMEERQKLEIRERVCELDERSPLTQQEIADRMGYSQKRGYQKILERGTTQRDRVEQLAEIHGVEADWIWGGSLNGSNPGPGPEAESLSAQLDTLQAVLLAELAQVKSVQEQILSHLERGESDEAERDAQ